MNRLLLGCAVAGFLMFSAYPTAEPAWGWDCSKPENHWMKECGGNGVPPTTVAGTAPTSAPTTGTTEASVSDNATTPTTLSGACIPPNGDQFACEGSQLPHTGPGSIQRWTWRGLISLGVGGVLYRVTRRKRAQSGP